MKKRRAVQNHIGTVHAIAICNLAEVAAGMSEATTPPTHRWIPKGMTVEYLKKAGTDLVATATLRNEPIFAEAMELPIEVEVEDAAAVVVVRATISMWITPRSS